jgi:hypothetical protein
VLAEVFVPNTVSLGSNAGAHMSIDEIPSILKALLVALAAKADISGTRFTDVIKFGPHAQFSVGASNGALYFSDINGLDWLVIDPTNHAVSITSNGAQVLRATQTGVAVYGKLITNQCQINGLSVYADNASALAGGLKSSDLYALSSDVSQIRRVL